MNCPVVFGAPHKASAAISGDCWEIPPPRFMRHERVPGLVPLLILLVTISSTFAEDRAVASRVFQSATAEARVSVSPHPRVLHFGKKNGPALLWEDPHLTRSGIRFIAFEKQGSDHLIHPFDEPATWIDETAFRARSKDLELDVSFELIEEVLHVNCRLTNRSEVERTLALWSIASVPLQGWLVTTASRGLENNRWIHGRVVSYWGTSLGEPCLRFGREALAVDLATPMQSPSLKIGTRSNAGWVALVRPDLGQMLVAKVPYDAADQYPDEDCNITIWVGESLQKIPYAEMEWLSPWTIIPPGKALVWNYVVEQRSFDPGTQNSPDTLLELIRQPVVMTSGHGGATSDHWRMDGEGPLIRDHFGKVTEWRSSSGKAMARTPLWKNAPDWQRETSSLIWNESTLVETDPSAIPVWSPEGRSWRVGFSLSDEARRLNRILFQDGDAEGGLLLALIDGKATAILWKEALPPTRLEAALSQGPDQEVQISYLPQPETFTLQVKGSTLVTRPSPAGLIAPRQRLAIGRNPKLPAEWEFQDLEPFLGTLHHLEVSPVKAETTSPLTVLSDLVSSPHSTRTTRACDSNHFKNRSLSRGCLHWAVPVFRETFPPQCKRGNTPLLPPGVIRPIDTHVFVGWCLEMLKRCIARRQSPQNLKAFLIQLPQEIALTELPDTQS